MVYPSPVFVPLSGLVSVNVDIVVEVAKDFRFSSPYRG